MGVACSFLLYETECILQYEIAGCDQPSQYSSRQRWASTLPSDAEAMRCWRTSGRWYILAISEAHLPRSLRRWVALSVPAACRISVAPPMRKALAPQCSRGMPAMDPIALARFVVSDVDHAPPEAEVKKGAVLASDSLSSLLRSRHAVSTASYASKGSVPRACWLEIGARRRTARSVGLLRTLWSLIATTRMSTHGQPDDSRLGSWNLKELSVKPLVGSQEPLSVRPSSPPRSNRLCARIAAAQFCRPRGEVLSKPARAASWRWRALIPRLRRRSPPRVPSGGCSRRYWRSMLWRRILWESSVTGRPKVRDAAVFRVDT